MLQSLLHVNYIYLRISQFVTCAFIVYTYFLITSNLTVFFSKLLGKPTNNTVHSTFLKSPPSCIPIQIHTTKFPPAFFVVTRNVSNNVFKWLMCWFSLDFSVMTSRVAPVTFNDNLCKCLFRRSIHGHVTLITVSFFFYRILITLASLLLSRKSLYENNLTPSFTLKDNVAFQSWKNFRNRIVSSEVYFNTPNSTTLWLCINSKNGFIEVDNSCFVFAIVFFF